MNVVLLTLVTILICLVAVLIVTLFIQLHKRGADKGLALIQQDINNLRGELRGSLEGTARIINQQLGHVGDRLDSAVNVVTDVQKGLGRLEEASRQIYEIGKDIASLQEILRAPKLRGGLGEFFLGELLEQIMPAQFFQMQYQFKSGHTVDAVLKFGDRLVPVDAKFPLESFKRLMAARGEDGEKRFRKEFINSVKCRIGEIAERYIVPDENTFEFALMYIPAENVYYETIIKDEHFDQTEGIYQYALRRKVIPVSPNSFYAYLQVIIFGLRGMRVEESVNEIIGLLSKIAIDFEKFKEDFRIVGKHIGATKTKFDDAERKLDRFADKLTSAVDPVRDKSITEPRTPLVDTERKELEV